MATGIGNNFEYLSPEFKTKFYKIEGNLIFAEGLGYGLGYNFKYHGKKNRKKLLIILLLPNIAALYMVLS
ncbi:MAG TPA: hypothetical protein VIY08_04280 [Candidatus Nitrosocosmicus sp.]